MQSKSWVTTFSAIETLLETVESIQKIADSDDIDTLSAVDESSDFPLLVMDFNGNSSFPIASGGYVEDEGDFAISVYVKIESYSSPRLAREALRPIVNSVLELLTYRGYGLGSRRVSYNYGVLGGSLKVASASFVITK